jgi:hypothetical protein
VILLAIGGMAAAASFTHVHNVAAAHGQPGWLAWADAVVLELMSIATGLEIRRRHRAGQPAGFVLAVLVGAVALSLSAQVVEAERSVVGWLAAALPALGFLALVKIVLTRTPVRAEELSTMDSVSASMPAMVEDRAAVVPAIGRPAAGGVCTGSTGDLRPDQQRDCPQWSNAVTTPTLAVVPADVTDTVARPGSRADRMSHPTGRDVLRDLAERHGVCPHPVTLRRIDTETGRADIIEVPCGATLAAKCKPCAERCRRLRIQQIREGWHLAEEPTVPVQAPGDDVLSLVRLRAHLEFERAEAERHAQWDQVPDLDGAIRKVENALAQEGLRGHLTPPDRKAKARKARSTKRRQDTPDLPRMPVDTRTVGRAYAGKRGQLHRPSMLLTLTLGSYGPVHSARRRGAYLVPCECGTRHGERDELLGTPIDPTSYDYRRAALDAIHFARVLDRWWQNLRRAAGWNVQYAGTVEMQRRLAPHAHFAIRGSLPRRLLKQVAAATYHQVWWPNFDRAVYTVETPPVWDPDRSVYVDPKSKAPHTTWGQAVDELGDDDARPAYVARLGTIDPREIKGVEAGSKDTERCIRYVTKYVTKNLTEQATPRGDAQRAHLDRLHAQLSTLPCSPGCANWLLYGVQPDGAKAGLIPGRCAGKVHQRETLGFTGRRVLISRQWSGKTLADHRADNRAWVKAIVAGAVDGHDQDPDDVRPDGKPRYRFELAQPGEPDVPPAEHRLLRAISTRLRWRAALAKARQGPPDPVSATQDPTTAAKAA